MSLKERMIKMEKNDHIPCSCDPKEAMSILTELEKRVNMLEAVFPPSYRDRFVNVSDWERRFKGVEEDIDRVRRQFDGQFTMGCKLDRIERVLSSIGNATNTYRTDYADEYDKLNPIEEE